MNKEKFLMELREYLRILENQEQEDILAEYAQHIDMKMGKGLSEEEAIRDFGPMEELASQILEAYHVKPEFRERSILPGFPKKSGMDGRELFVKRAGRWIGAKCAAAARAGRNAFRWLSRRCHALAGWLKKPFMRNRAETGGEMPRSRIRTERMNDMGVHTGNFFRMVGRGIAASWRWLLHCCVFWLRIMWNMGWLFFSLFCAFVAMIALMGIGGILILLFQGYPFVGFFVINLGGFLCSGALACGGYSLLIRKKRGGEDKDKREGAEESDGEVQHGQIA